MSSNTTPGLRRDFEELVNALRRCDFTVATATSSYGLLRPLRCLGIAADELVVASSLRYATLRVTRRSRPRLVLITTSTGGALLPRSLLARAGVRFDGLAVGTRLRWQDAPSRAFERRALRHARLALPYTERARADLTGLFNDQTRCLVWPSPVRPGPPPSRDRRPAALCYANDPEKKGLDLAVAAWASAAPQSHRLLITGITPQIGQRFLHQRGVVAPANVEWLGRLSEADYRRISASVLMYLGTSRVDQFATTQLEALLDGALLVTAPSKGPIEALDLARQLDSRLVAESVTKDAVAQAIEAALGLTTAEQFEYRSRAASLLAPYSRERFVERLRTDVLPLLLTEPEAA